jgi:hypothetical protein
MKLSEEKNFDVSPKFSIKVGCGRKKVPKTLQNVVQFTVSLQLSAISKYPTYFQLAGSVIPFFLLGLKLFRQQIVESD